MPTYNFHNTKADEKWTEYMSISEMEDFIKKKHIKLSKVSEAHPASSLAQQYGKKSVKDTQIDSVIKKHRAKKAGKKV